MRRCLLALICCGCSARTSGFHLAASPPSSRGVSLKTGLHASSALAPSSAAERPVTWCSSGEDLVQVDKDVWVIERPFMWNGINVGGRSTVIRLPDKDGSLWIHSPLQLDAQLRDALAELGPVRMIVSPNYEHVKYAQDWIDAFPDAKSYGCPGMVEKEKDIAFDGTVGEGQAVPEGWPEAISVCHVDCERVPILNTPFFSEVIFFHRPTSSLITSDFYWNYPSNNPLMTPQDRFWKFAMDRIYLPFYRTFMIKGKYDLDKVMNTVSAWGPQRLIPCHGDVLTAQPIKALFNHVIKGRPTQ